MTPVYHAVHAERLLEVQRIWSIGLPGKRTVTVGALAFGQQIAGRFVGVAASR